MRTTPYNTIYSYVPSKSRKFGVIIFVVELLQNMFMYLTLSWNDR